MEESVSEEERSQLPTKKRSIKMKTEQLATCRSLVTSARIFRSGREKNNKEQL